jgi:hypothetical protein
LLLKIALSQKQTPTTSDERRNRMQTGKPTRQRGFKSRASTHRSRAFSRYLLHNRAARQKITPLDFIPILVGSLILFTANWVYFSSTQTDSFGLTDLGER